jgi:hypothetical protein
MANSLSVFEVAGQRAADRFSALVNRLRFLLGSLPHLPDAFSSDDRPISFILRRDSPPNNERRRSRRNKTPPFVRKANSHARARAAEHRPAARSTLRPGSHPAVRADDASRCHLSGSSHSNQRVS